MLCGRVAALSNALARARYLKLKDQLRMNYHGLRNQSTRFDRQATPDAEVVLRYDPGPKARGESPMLRTWSYSILMMSAIFVPLHAIAAEQQLDGITIEAQRNERAQLRLQVDQYVTSAVVHHVGESLMRWDTPVCPLVGGLPREQGEFILQRVSQAARSAGVPLAPEQCTANLFILASSQADRLLEELPKKRPGLFDTTNGLGGLQHFLRTDRPVRVWYNWQNQGDASAAIYIVATFLGNSPTVGGAFGPGALSGAGTGIGGYRMPNSRLSLTVTKSINTAIIIVDTTRMKGINVGQLADYVTMVGLAEINLDRTIISAPSVLRLFSEPSEAPVDGMSRWDQALLKSLYSTHAESVMQISDMETQMVDAGTIAHR
jgi:hypothetical protein